MRNRKVRFNVKPYLFLLPCMAVFVLFVFLPFVKTLLFSFTLTNFRGNPVEFVGLDNYTGQFNTPLFLNSLKLTLLFAPMVGIPTLLGAYFLAALAQEKIPGGRMYEVMYSLPMAVASVPAAAIWMRLFSSGESGIMNHILGTNIGWLYDSRYALVSVAVVTVWLQTGASFIFMLSGFRNVPDELIESARIDGAGYFTRLFKIITPVASPQIFFVVFLNVISSFQAFGQIRVLTQGGPAYATSVLVYTIYEAGIRDSRFETAYARSIVLFLILLAVTILQFKTEKRMVHYQ